MRIISKFQDYYDGVQHYGQDEDNIWVRNEKQESYKNFPLIEQLWDTFVKPGHIRQIIVIGFCGKIYPCFRFYSNRRDSKGASEEDFIYSLEELEQYKPSSSMHKKDYERNIKYYFNSISAKGWRHEEDVFELAKKDYSKIFLEYNIPLFAIGNGLEFEEDGRQRLRKSTIKFNPQLKNYNFQSIKDPYTCYQELSTFVGGYLRSTEVDTVDIGDEYMRDSKGFDEWSFKTMPGTKKPRRNKK